MTNRYRLLAETCAPLALVIWRVSRKSMDGFGVQADWLFVIGLLWLAWILLPRRLHAPLLLCGCSYLFVLYGYFQLGASVSLFWMLVEGG